MKKYTILALALVLCVTGLTGCRRNKGLADGTIPSTTMATTPTTHATTVPTTAATTVPATTENRPNSTTDTTEGTMTDATTPTGKSRARTVMPGVG